MVVLRYFDPLNFAQDIRCPSLVGLSRKDEVVPPEPSLRWWRTCGLRTS